MGATFPDEDLIFNKFGLLRYIRNWLKSKGHIKKRKRSIFTHRGITHTIFFAVIVSFIIFYSIDLIIKFVSNYIHIDFLLEIIKSNIAGAISLGFIVAYLIHIIGDCLTPMGCPLLYPIFPIEKRIKFKLIKIDGASEKIFIIISYLMIFYSFIFIVPKVAILFFLFFQLIIFVLKYII